MAYEDVQLELVPHVYQGALVQQRSNDGYINATAMCKAAGKEWSNYSQNSGTKAFLDALEGSLGIPRDRIVQSIVTGENDGRGTWVHPQVAIHLAQWLSPEFAVKVTEWVYDWMSGKDPTEKVWKQFEDRVSLVYDNVPDGYFCVFQEMASLFATLIAKGANPGTSMVPDISVGMQWATHWKSNNLDHVHGPRKYFDHYYPEYFPQSYSNPQPVACYPDSALGAFRRWFRSVYVSQKFGNYLKTQVQQQRLPAKVANDTLAILGQNEIRRAIPRASK